jgi:hypothetical protein
MLAMVNRVRPVTDAVLDTDCDAAFDSAADLLEVTSSVIVSEQEIKRHRDRKKQTDLFIPFEALVRSK